LFAQAGAQLVIGYHSDAEGAASLTKELSGGPHQYVRLPMEDSAAISAAARQVERAFGKVDVLVNAAGVTHAIAHHDLDALTDEIFDQLMLVNVRGPFATVRAFAPLLKKSGDAAVINVSSISGTTGLGSNIAYCAAKGALNTMGLSLARVLAPDIRVIGVAPAAVVTDFVPGRGRAGAEKQAASTPLKIVAEADDVAQAIFAAVVHLRLTTGETLLVDSGRHL
jgi:3-oxoacyl-[acyl-carrier protein] reductase